MTDWRQPQHVVELPMFDSPEAPERSRIPYKCDDIGPYVAREHQRHDGSVSYTMRRCTRPEGHEGNHQFSRTKGPTHEWTRDWQPVRPMKGFITNGQ